MSPSVYGQNLNKIMTLRVAERDEKNIELLSDSWCVSKGEAIRKAIQFVIDESLELEEKEEEKSK